MTLLAECRGGTTLAGEFIWRSTFLLPPNVLEYIPVLVIALAGALKGFSGLGFALVSVPLLALVWDDPKKIVTYITLCSLVQTCIMLKWAIPRVPWKVLPPLFAGMTAGVVVGILLLDILKPEPMFLILGAIVLAISIWKLSGWMPGKPVPDLPISGTVACGIVTGVIGAVSCANGPPLILYSAVRGWSAETIKAFVQPVFIFAAILQLIGYLYIDTVTSDLLILAAISIVPMVPATVVGMRFADRIPQQAFERAFYSFVLISGVALLYRGL